MAEHKITCDRCGEKRHQIKTGAFGYQKLCKRCRNELAGKVEQENIRDIHRGR